MDFEVNANQRSIPVVQFGNQVDVVFPKLVVRPDVHCAGVIFGHQIQAVQSFHCQVVFRQ